MNDQNQKLFLVRCTAVTTGIYPIDSLGVRMEVHVSGLEIHQRNPGVEITSTGTNSQLFCCF